MKTRNLAAKATALAIGISVVLVSMLVPTASNADPLAPSCTTVEGVFARGSGQAPGEGEAVRFRDQLEKRVKAPLTQNYYELGSESVAGHKYPAVPVKGSVTAIQTAADAKFSSGGAFTYGASVNAGVDELDAYIEQRLAKCPTTLFILGGYSQGAQVIGETYVERLTPTERGRVVFSALFGDPKLYLPEGVGWDAPACKGQDLSEWRRVVPDCNTDNGSLGARNPFLPASWMSTTGLWCATHDFVCGSSKFVWDTAGHGTYVSGSDIDVAVLEAVKLLQARLPEEDSDLLDVTFQLFQSGRTGLDVVFVIDSTGSMSGQIDQAKATAASLSGFVAANRGALTLDRGHGVVSVMPLPRG